MKKIIVMVIFGCLLWVSLAIAGEKVIYVVKRGDTLGELMYVWQSRQGVDVKKIFIWNPSLGTQIQIGQKIIYYLPDQTVTRKLTEDELRNVVAETMSQIAKEAAKVPTESFVGKMWRYLILSFIIAVAVLIPSIGIPLYFRSKSKKAEKVKAEAMTEAEKKAKAEIDFVEQVTIDGYSLEIRYMAEMDRWYSPFRNQDRSFIYSKTRSEIIGSSSRCLKNPKFSEQLLKHLESGEIKK